MFDPNTVDMLGAIALLTLVAGTFVTVIVGTLAMPPVATERDRDFINGDLT